MVIAVSKMQKTRLNGGGRFIIATPKEHSWKAKKTYYGLANSI